MTSPKRVMIAAWGSRGDLQPVASLALRLQKEDRDVLVFATPPATALFEANGIDCVVAKENIEAFVENMFGQIESSPHDWLFPQCAAVVHHGGAGTLAAGIRAGCPTIVCATQGDQPFYESLVQARGIGRYLGMIGSSKLTAARLATGIEEVMTDQSLIAAARAMSVQVQSEDGVANAIRFIDKMATSFSYPWSIRTEYNKQEQQLASDT